MKESFLANADKVRCCGVPRRDQKKPVITERRGRPHHIIGGGAGHGLPGQTHAVSIDPFDEALRLQEGEVGACLDEPVVVVTGGIGAAVPGEHVAAVGGRLNRPAPIQIVSSESATPQAIAVGICSQQPKIVIPSTEGFRISGQDIPAIGALRCRVALIPTQAPEPGAPKAVGRATKCLKNNLKQGKSDTYTELNVSPHASTFLIAR
jgi:hypothetical protein